MDMRFIPDTMKFADAPRDTSSKARPSAVRWAYHEYPSAPTYVAQRRAVGRFRRSRSSLGGAARPLRLRANVCAAAGAKQV
jgi:hypothetical protein